MDPRIRLLASKAIDNHAVVSIRDCDQVGVDRRVRYRWIAEGLLLRLGPRSSTFAGTAPTWHRSLAAGIADLDGHGVIAGRAGARLHGLDGFRDDDLEFLLPRAHRQMRTVGRTASTDCPIGKLDVQRIDGLPVLRAERLIVDSPRFGFSRAEMENSIDSAIRLRRVSEQRLRTRAIASHHRGLNGGRALIDALVDMGGESRLERWFLALVRQAGLPRPNVQRTFRDGTRIVARVDALFPGMLVVEVAGHGTHSSRRQRQIDAQRHTELTLHGYRVLTFTYDDIRDRPAWVVRQLRAALPSTQ